MSPRHWLGLFALAALASNARAEGRSSAVSCATPRGAALGQMSCELTAGLPAARGEILVVPIGVDVAKGAPAGDELARRLAQQVAADLGPSARASSDVVSRRAAAGLARRDRDVAIVEGKLSNERFTATLDLVRAQKFWERFATTDASPFAHAHSSRPLDGELRGYLPAVPLVVSRIDRAAPLDEPSLALGCGDIDGDGSLEIVSVGRRRIQVGRIVRGRFDAFATAAWAELSEVAPRPLREPIALVSVLPGGGLTVGSSDRAEGLKLDGKLQVLERFPGRLPVPGGGCMRASAIGLAEAVGPCTGRERSAPDAAGAVDAVAAFALVQRNGQGKNLFARRKGDGKLELRFGSREVAFDEVVGAQLALGELNGDGRAELLTTIDTLDEARDALVVRTLDDTGAAKPAFRVPVPSGVRALAVCPSEGVSLAPIVLATGDGLWVLR